MLSDINIVIWFFILGFIVSLLNPKSYHLDETKKALTIFLLIAIGIKGGASLNEYASWSLVFQSVSIVALAIILCLIAFYILRFFGQLNLNDAASMAAHYGSISVATFAVAIHFLDSLGVYYEPYFPLFIVLLEVPAILVGLYLACDNKNNRLSAESTREIFLNESVLILMGATLIGIVSHDQVEKISLLFDGLFSGVLALFLLLMGMSTAKSFHKIKESGTFIISFALFMPILGGLLGLLLAKMLGFSQGGALLLAVLNASASYIAVPAAMNLVLPQANNSQAISSSLLITFPFNAILGIPFFYQVITTSFPA